MNLNSKQTWIKIKEEYEEGIKEHECAWALCTVSETFKLAWNHELMHKIILKHAQKFLELRDEPDSTSDFLLFYCNESKITEEEREIRLDFINYMIDNCNEEVQVNS